VSLSTPAYRIGLFLGLAIVALGAMVAVTRYPQLFRRGREYRAAFNNVAGLNVGDEVRYGGLVVGSVTSIDLDTADATRLLVKLRVRERTPVRVDTRASISQVGLLGQQFLSLSPGRPDAPPLAPGALIASDDALNFQDAMNQLALFFQRTDTLLTGVDRFVRTDPFARLDRTLTRLDDLVANASSGSERLVGSLDTASRQLNEVLLRADRVIAALDTTVGVARPAFSETQREALSTLRETRTLVADLRDALQQGGGVDQLLRNVSAASDNLARLSARLERDPSSVLKQRALPAKAIGPSLRE
jgi:phospholipid/cholesterol/gamma-HCH transport system substrate-binding protein